MPKNKITAKTLLVIIPDHLSHLLKKGEVIARYYNPGDFFDEVHILMSNTDKPEATQVQKMVGRAKLVLHNLPQPPHFFRNTLGWQKSLLQPWINEGLALARRIKPQLVRAHNNFLEGYLASCIKKVLNIPYVVSLHRIWDEDNLEAVSPLERVKKHIHATFRKKLEISTLESADEVFCVYSPLLHYAKTHGAKNPRLLHNFVSNENIIQKSNYELANPVKLITVNQQLPGKNPAHIIKAIRDLNVEYTLIGDGALHESLVQLSKQIGVNHKIRFIKSLPNEVVCQKLSESDILVSHCQFKGISKTIIEAGLTGLPIIINKYTDIALEEYDGGWVGLCEDTEIDYAQMIQKFINDKALREMMGKKALQKTHSLFLPAALEHKVYTIYQQLSENGQVCLERSL